MATLSLSRLQQVVDRFEQVEARMGATTETDEIIALSKEHSELKPVVDKAREVMTARKGLEEAQALASSGDAEMAELAQMEIEDIKDRLPDLEQEMQVLLLPKDVDDAANIVLEVRAGTGGDEAALFAGDLYRMYTRYAQTMGWKVEVVDASEGDAGGYKVIVANIAGDGVFWHTLDAFIRRPRLWLFCLRPRMSRSKSNPKTSVSTQCGLPVRAASTSIQRTPRCVSPILRPVSW